MSAISAGADRGPGGRATAARASNAGRAGNTLLEGFCAIWIAGDGEPIGRVLADDEAIDILTGLLSYGLAGPRRRAPEAARDVAGR